MYVCEREVGKEQGRKDCTCGAQSDSQAARAVKKAHIVGAVVISRHLAIL